MTHRLGLALAALLATAACGSTVPLATGSSQSPGYDGLSGPTAPTGADTGAPGAGTSSPQAVAPPGGSGSGSAVRPGVTTAAPTGPRSVASVAPRTTAPVKVGFFVSEDVGAALAAFGLSGLSSGDGPTQARVATELLNKAGGLDGRKVVPVVYEASATTDESQKQTQQQAACARFFTDNRVAAVVSVLPTEILSECSRRNGAPLSVSSISTLSRDALQRFPNVALPNQLERDHGVAVIVPSLARYGYFTPRDGEKVKVGLVTNGTKEFEPIPALVDAELRRLGLSLADTATMSTADKASGEASAAVLRFQAAGITHVVVVDDHGGAMTFFLLAAGSQGYYPRLGLSSYEIPQVAADVLPARHFQDAVGVGWLPTFDVSISDADRTLTAPARTCAAAMTRAGEDMSTSGSRGIALGVCDSAFALQQAVRGRGVTLDGYLGGLTALGTGYASTLTFATDFRGGRRDGAASLRPLGYDASCSCFHYTGPAVRA